MGTKLSVVIATMDRPSYLERTIASLKQSRVEPHEVVVVDDGHEPGTRQVAADWSARWSTVRYTTTGGAGTSKARNVGVQAATGDVILITDDDCLAHEDCVGRVIETFETDPEAQCVTGRVLSYGDVAGKIGVALLTDPERHQWKGRTYPWGMGHSSNMSFRREAYLRIGGFDEEMGPGTKLCAAEDLDILYRLLRDGGKVVYEPEAIIFHDQWRSRAQARGRRADYARGTAAFLLKHLIEYQDPYALGMLVTRLWQDVPLLALIGLAKRNLELELVSMHQAWGLATGFWVAGRHYARKRWAGDVPAPLRT